jgi:hypothetical protein
MKPVWLALSLGILSAAALAADEVEVSTVKFTNLRAPNGTAGNWLEADIALNVHPAPGAVGAMVSREVLGDRCDGGRPGAIRGPRERFGRAHQR